MLTFERPDNARIDPRELYGVYRLRTTTGNTYTIALTAPVLRDTLNDLFDLGIPEDGHISYQYVERLLVHLMANQNPAHLTLTFCPCRFLPTGEFVARNTLQIRPYAIESFEYDDELTNYALTALAT